MPSKSLSRDIRLKIINKYLTKKYPKISCALNFNNIWQLTVATILSAQCTDKTVNKITATLFHKYPEIDDYLNLKTKNFEKEIKSAGFYRIKAKNILNCAKIINEKYQKKVPQKIEELISLPGIARKTANVICGVGYHKNQGIVVDTHVKRITERLGLSKNTNPTKIETDLIKILDQKEWTNFPLRLIAFGREICLARNPKCAICPFTKICLYYLNSNRK